jgi:hypothetical protein
MSFGFHNEPLVNGKWIISNAITDAFSPRNQQVLFFCAAGNYGGNVPVMFPARHAKVMSVRATDATGGPVRGNPPEDRIIDSFGLMTLGKDVPCTTLSRDGGGEVYCSGSSISTPIAAGIAAMILGFIRLNERKLVERLGQCADARTRLSHYFTLEGMRYLLGKMSTLVSGRFYYLSPVRFLQELTEDELLAYLAGCAVEFFR